MDHSLDHGKSIVRLIVLNGKRRTARLKQSIAQIQAFSRKVLGAALRAIS